MSLEDFVEQYGGRPTTAWADATLPDDIKQQIYDTPTVGARKIVRWLWAMGYEEATDSKIEYLRRSRRA